MNWYIFYFALVFYVSWQTQIKASQIRHHCVNNSLYIVCTFKIQQRIANTHTYTHTCRQTNAEKHVGEENKMNKQYSNK